MKLKNGIKQLAHAVGKIACGVEAQRVAMQVMENVKMLHGEVEKLRRRLKDAEAKIEKIEQARVASE